MRVLIGFLILAVILVTLHDAAQSVGVSSGLNQCSSG
jgi:hypothetical protein